MLGARNDLLFCYGTLCAETCWRATGAPTPETALPALLQGYRSFHIPASSSSGIAPDPQSSVPGLLITISPTGWDALDAQEGEHYQRSPVSVTCAQETLVVWTYLWRPHIKAVPLASHKEWASMLARHYFEQWHYLHPDSTLKQWENSLFTQCSPQGVDAIWVGVFNNTPVACARLRASDMGQRRDFSPWLAGMLTFPPLRNCGIGPQLVHIIEREALRQGYRKLYLWTHDRMNFYARQGFRACEQQVYLGEPTTVMVKSLHANAQ